MPTHDNSKLNLD